MKREVAIVHFNTPELTEACVWSLRKHGGQDYHVKCFVQGGLDEIHFAKNPHSPSDSIRCVNSEGKRVPCSAFTPYTHKVMRIDHYWTKTADEWRTNKLARGFASGATYIENFMKKQEEYFFKVNERTPEKEAVIRG